MSRGQLVIIGSGETAPSMVEVHRTALADAGPGPALVLDTPYGFQENADALTRKALDYFATNVGRTLTPLRWRTELRGVELDRALLAVRAARFVYAGPGSPTYTMRVWAGSGLAEAIRDMVDAGGSAVFSSAAALTVGVVTLPAHEIYRCGVDPYWIDGTNLLAELTGLSAAVLPHYDHSKGGGSHDTRFCYIGARRLRMLEEQLPSGAHVIGVDEHTALVLDLAEGTARVRGQGGVTVRRDGVDTVLPTRSVVPIAGLAGEADVRCPAEPASAGRAGAEEAGSAGARHAVATLGVSERDGSVRPEADRAYAAFTAALSARDAQAAAAAILGLEHILVERGIDAPGRAHARRVLRGMVLELAGAAADGLADRRRILEPLVTALLEQRTAARRRRDFAAADALRERLAGVGVEVRDTHVGVEWSVGSQCG
jgi:cyanophycinase-like exopeptidase